jgi:hypothetical protein
MASFSFPFQRAPGPWDRARRPPIDHRRKGWLLNLLDVVFACARLRRMDSEIASAALQRLLGINKSIFGRHVAKGIAVWGNKRGSYRVETITRYCEHLREIASARGGERAEDARARSILGEPRPPVVGLLRAGYVAGKGW